MQAPRRRLPTRRRMRLCPAPKWTSAIEVQGNDCLGGQHQVKSCPIDEWRFSIRRTMWLPTVDRSSCSGIKCDWATRQGVLPQDGEVQASLLDDASDVRSDGAESRRSVPGPITRRTSQHVRGISKNSSCVCGITGCPSRDQVRG